MREKYAKEELLDNNEGPIQHYRIQGLAERMVKSPENIKGTAKWFAVSYVITLGILFCAYPLSGLWQLMILDIFIAPGTGLLLLGIYSFFPSSHRKIDLDPELKKVTAIITDHYHVVEKGTDSEGGVCFETTYYTVYDCNYDGVHYKLEEANGGDLSGKRKNIGDKKVIYLDLKYPEKSVTEDELYYVENGSGCSSLIVVLFGAIWVGMFILAAILDVVK